MTGEAKKAARRLVGIAIIRYPYFHDPIMTRIIPLQIFCQCNDINSNHNPPFRSRQLIHRLPIHPFPLNITVHSLLRKPLRRSRHFITPPKRIINFPLLHPLQCRQQFLTHRTRIQGFVDRVLELVASAFHRYAFDGNQACCCAGSHHLREGREFSVGNRATLDSVAEGILCNLACGLGGHGLDDVFGVGDDYCGLAIGICPDAEEARGRELVDFRARLAVEMQCDTEAGLTSALTVAEDGGVVAADLGGTCALWCGAVEVFENQGVDGVHTVVDARGHDEDDEGIFIWWAEAELGGGAEEEWADVHCCAGFVGWDEFGVRGDGEIDAVDEVLFRDWWDGDEFSGALHAEGVLVWAEDCDAARRGAEGFHAFIALDAVVEAWCHAVDGEMRRWDEARW